MKINLSHWKIFAVIAILVATITSGCDNEKESEELIGTPPWVTAYLEMHFVDSNGASIETSIPSDAELCDSLPDRKFYLLPYYKHFQKDKICELYYGKCNDGHTYMIIYGLMYASETNRNCTQLLFSRELFPDKSNGQEEIQSHWVCNNYDMQCAGITFRGKFYPASKTDGKTCIPDTQGDMYEVYITMPTEED